ncbi:condensation domain-containing protein [Streptomyces sp. NPDC059070]|uniref:condensation domain-containing protein n=1 Tax=unclassified Streptomyces TaxID=2593676 RepID=UPI0034E1F2B3
MPDLNPAAATARPYVPFTYEQDWYRANIRQSGGAHKNVRLSYEILGDFDPDAFTEALRGFVARHDALHLAPLPEGGPEGQYLRPPRPDEQTVERQSVTAASARQFSHYAAALLSRDFVTPWSEPDAQRPFTLRLLRHTPRHHALLATFQNLVFDGRGHALFAHEIWRDYATLLAGGTPPATAPSFADAALSQRTRYGPGHLARAARSWRERLDFAARNPWPGSGGQSSDAGSVHVEFGAEAVAALRRACEREHCTVPQWLVASFARATARRTGLARLALWVTMDSRRARERDLVGMLAGASPLALRRADADAATVRDEVRGQLLEALRHQQLTAAELLALSQEFGGAQALRRDIYVSLRTIVDDDREVRRATGPLRVTADAHPLRRTTLVSPSALHLSCVEHRDKVVVDLVFDGLRAGRPLAGAIVDAMAADLASLPSAPPVRPADPPH